MATLVIIPGWRDPGTGHWHSLWADQIPGAVGINQDDWISPTRTAWVNAITRTILEQDGPVVIAALSLGCIATSHLPPEAAERIQGALLAAPADPERRGVLADFAPVPYQRLPYPSIVVDSNNDPYAWYAQQALTRGPGEVNWCACKTQGKSMWSQATVIGRWAWLLCRRYRRCLWPRLRC